MARMTGKDSKTGNLINSDMSFGTIHNQRNCYLNLDAIYK